MRVWRKWGGSVGGAVGRGRVKEGCEGRDKRPHYFSLHHTCLSNLFR